MDALALYLDEHVPRAVAEALVARGLDVMTVQDDGRTGEDDDVLLDRATGLDRILVTQDSDFLALAATRQTAGRSFAGIAFVSRSSLGSLGDYIDCLELFARTTPREQAADRVSFLPD